MSETAIFRPADLEALPAVLRLVAEECGVAAALELSERCGARRFYVPLSAEGSKLEEEAGEAVADCLVSHFPGEYVIIPQITDRLRALRRMAYVAQRPEAGTSELAQALGMSHAGVQLIRRRLRERSGAKPTPKP